jgi:xanthine dehydrogenase FAD-binding subunit
MRPQGVAIAILNVATWVLRREDVVEDVRLAVGPAGPKPFRARAAEESLRGHSLNAERLRLAVDAMQSEVKFRTSPHRATAEYRHHIARSLMEDTLMTAWQRAGN